MFTTAKYEMVGPLSCVTGLSPFCNVKLAYTTLTSNCAVTPYTWFIHGLMFNSVTKSGEAQAIPTVNERLLLLTFLMRFSFFITGTSHCLMYLLALLTERFCSKAEHINPNIRLTLAVKKKLNFYFIKSEICWWRADG